MRNREFRKNTLRIAACAAILCVVVVSWTMLWLRYYAPDIPRTFGWKGHLLVVFVYAVLSLIFISFYGGFRFGYYRPADVALSGVLGLCFCNFVTWLQTCLIGADIVPLVPIFLLTVCQSVIIAVWSLAANRLYQRYVPPHKLLLIHNDTSQTESLTAKIATRPEKYEIIEDISLSDGFDAALERISNYRAVVLCDLPAAERNELLKYCFSKGIRTYTTPKTPDILIRGATYINLFDTPLLLNSEHALTLEQRAVKRVMDVLLALVALIVTSPLLLVSAVAIKLTDHGPVFYHQERLTRGGRVFRLHKLRSMQLDAEEDGRGARLSTGENDDRVTRVGRVLRRWRIDELPQFWNIIKGDMSLVGPRPERPEMAAEYEKEMPEFSYRLKVKAGLTGFAQVAGRYNTSPFDKLKLDLMYIAGFSIAEDFKLILTTLKIIFFKESTEGVEE
jgi:exopolysaccharide biosynthesis polyprenyl glycosylphosphotransferase